MRLPGGAAAAAATAVLLAAAFLLRAGIPVEAPFSGDNGIRLWQTEASLQGRAALPRALPAGAGAGSYPPPLSLVTQDGVVSSYPASFPAAASLLGTGSLTLARLFVLLCTALAAWPLAVLAGGGMAGGMAAFAVSGVAPYAFVFWEHGPAMLPALVWASMFFAALHRDDPLPFWILPLALAAAWRPEMLPAAAGASLPLMAGRRTGPGARAAWIGWIALACLSAVPILFPVLLPARVAGNLPAFRGAEALLESRLSILSSWTVPASNIPAVAAVIAWIIVMALPARLARRAPVSIVAAASALVLLYYFSRKSLGTASAFMLAPGLALAPLLRRYETSGSPRLLERAALGSAAALILLSPTDGLFQFGPRFLLLPIALIAASMARACLGAGRAGAFALGAAVALSVFGSVRGVMFQDFFRLRHAELAASIMQAPEGYVVATDEEWLPLVAWSAAVRRPVLYSPQPPVRGALDGRPAFWLSGQSSAGISYSGAGYRGLAWSGPGAACLEPPPGDLQPDPWRGIP